MLTKQRDREIDNIANDFFDKLDTIKITKKSESKIDNEKK